MTELRGRVAEITIDTLRLAGHRATFKIEKSLKPEPNTCELAVWNLSEDQRASLEELEPRADSPRGIPVKIEAGYEDGTSLIWLGDVRTVDSVRDGADWITVLTSGDGEKAYQTSRAAVSYGPKTPVDTALRAMVRALGIGEGNVAKAAAELKLKGFGKLISQGAVISGSVSRRLTDWARSADLEWSIQDGAVQLVNRDSVLEGIAVRLTPETGLIGSPTVDNEGVLTAQMLMIPDVRPGALLVVESSRISGNYRIEKAAWEGDTHEGPWYITVEASRF